MAATHIASHRPSFPRGSSVRPIGLLVALLVSWVAAGSASGQPYGRGNPTAIGAFLDGTLPTRTPSSPASTTWDLVDAFPSLSLPNTLVIQPNPDDDRLYVGSRAGVIVSFDNSPLVSTSEPFMDLTDRVAVVWDGGFLGMAFHPEFGQAGSPNEATFYTYYSSYCPTTANGQDIDFGACNPTYPTGSTGGFFNTWLRLSKFQAYYDGASGAWKGDPATEEPLFNIRLYNSSHRGGGPVFANDGTLWVAIGDQFRYETAQDIASNFEGGAVRIEVDVTDNGDGTWACPAGSHQPGRRLQDVTLNPDESTGRLYCIPDDNPFPAPSDQHFEEFATVGNRNPHRIALDPVTGLIWSGEVGQSTREEVNVLIAGRNYQWPYMEGNATGPRSKPATIVGVEQPPVIDFDRNDARAIIGGYVYRGTMFPELSGRYIAGDYSTSNIWAITLDINTMTATADYLTNFDPGSLGTFGQDKNGEVFLGSVASNTPLQRLDRIGDPPPEAPLLLSDLAAFDDVVSLDVHDAGVPYDLVPFWSDGAAKQRWIFLPNDGTHDTAAEQIVFSELGNWSFPVGTVLMKHFELPTDETDPNVRRRLETRFLAFGDDGKQYGLTYRWRLDETDADLLTVAETADYTIQLEGGGSTIQTWLFPSRNDCLTCHTNGAGHALGLRTHQQNRDFTYPSTGVTDNQLRTWNHLGMFNPALLEPNIPTYLAGSTLGDPTSSIEHRMRSWLDSNCANCHRPETGNRAVFDARLTTPLASQGLVWGGVIDDLGLGSGAYLIHPGNPLLSVLNPRVNAAGGSPIAMPPIAKQLADPDASNLLYEWILRVSPDYPRIGVSYEYYEETGLTVLPDFDSLIPVTTGSASTFDISLRERDNDFAFRFTGYVEIPAAGTWTFYTSSDDGSQLFVAGTLVVDNDGLHGNQEQSGTIALGADYYEIVVTFFERGGGEVLNVSWEGPGVAKQAIPPANLYREIPIPIVNAPPTLTDPGPQIHDEGEAVSLMLAATDPDLGDLLYFDAKGLPAGLSLDSSSGAITGTLPIGSTGEFTVTYGVSDGPAVDSIQNTWHVPEPDALLSLVCGCAALIALAHFGDRERFDRASRTA
jgi:hypothetical protein